MLLASAGALAALAFVLGLFALLVWFLKRGGHVLSRRQAVAVEVVQRVSVGPKTSLAVVRVGEKVMAMSIGEGGMQPLFELDEADRARVLALRANTAADADDDPRVLKMASAFFTARPAARTASSTGRFAPFAEALADATQPSVTQTVAAPVAARALLPADLSRALNVALAPATRLAALLLAATLAFAPLQAGAQSANAPVAPPASITTPAASGATGTTGAASANAAPVVPQIDISLGGADGGLRLSGAVGVVVMMGLLTLLPTLLLMMTSFTRILVVLQFLKQAMGTQSAPPAQLVAALALLLTGFVMAPTLQEANRTALQPWLDGQMEQVEMLKTGVKPFRTFMLAQTKEADLRTFVELARLETPPATADDVPLHVLMSAFVASELRTAFQIGFAIYLPFIVIDAVVASVLMSMGMMMLPPAMISLPFKLLLFVLVDGWSLTMESLVKSFH